MAKASTSAETAHPAAHQYVVVARRYRPQGFDELIGQEHVAQALSNAIATHRVGHAYLFIGARGTGKTSTARIFAKALECEHGPTATPCNQCDICQSISSGDDVDVLEIDGASNTGIDHIRELRQNANVRPSRARFKIYIIDEVHMLSTQAFNGLLKTLEEPPEHVKFIFCTTEARKIPITIMSRCQRFEFAGIPTRSIFERLRQIVAAEGVEAEPEALEVIARRAAGSMRDSQSLLEQLLAFAPQRITVADVHGMLGTAGDQRLATLVQHLMGRNPAGALAELDAAAHEGVDVAQLIEQLFGYFRDCMVAAVGCPADTFLYASPSNSHDVVEAGKRLGLQTILAAMQILDQSLSRLRVSTQSRILAELALVRICHLEELDELANWIVELQSGQPLSVGPTPPRPTLAAPAAVLPQKKNNEVGEKAEGGRTEKPGSTGAVPVATDVMPEMDAAEDAPEEEFSEPVGVAGVVLTAENAADIWNRALERVRGTIVDHARQFCKVGVSGANRLAVFFPAATGALPKSLCQRPQQVAAFEQALAEVVGRTLRVEFNLIEAEAGGAAAAPVAPARPTVSPHQRILEVAKHPMVCRAGELFGAQPTGVEEG